MSFITYVCVRVLGLLIFLFRLSLSILGFVWSVYLLLTNVSIEWWFYIPFIVGIVLTIFVNEYIYYLKFEKPLT